MGLAAFVVGARRATTGRVSPVEERMFRAINRLPEGLHPPVWTVMQAGSLGAVGVAAGVAHRLGRPRQAAALGLSGAAIWAACKAVKPLVGRGRPEAHLDSVSVRGPAQTGLGYPSGHSAVAADLAFVALAGTATGVGLSMAAVAGVVGFARVYTGAHLPLDVLGGWGLGIAAGALARVALRLFPGS